MVKKKMQRNPKMFYLAFFAALYRIPSEKGSCGKTSAVVFLLGSMHFRDIRAENHIGQQLSQAFAAKTLAQLSVAAAPAL
jgi:hypothetical protein